MDGSPESGCCGNSPVMKYFRKNCPDIEMSDILKEVTYGILGECIVVRQG
jgi:hypothetical protein